MGGRDVQLTVKLDDDEAAQVETYRAWMEDQTKAKTGQASALRALIRRGYDAWLLERKRKVRA